MASNENCRLTAIARRSLDLELKSLLTDLESCRRLDCDLRHPQPESVRRLVVLGVPATLRAAAVEANVPRFAEWIVQPADRARGVRANPVFIIDEKDSVADFLADQLSHGWWPIR